MLIRWLISTHLPTGLYIFKIQETLFTCTPVKKEKKKKKKKKKRIKRNINLYTHMEQIVVQTKTKKPWWRNGTTSRLVNKGS